MGKREPSVQREPRVGGAKGGSRGVTKTVTVRTHVSNWWVRWRRGMMWPDFGYE